MPPRAWKILPAIVFLTCGAHATDNIGSFGNWRITFEPNNHTYNLIGSSQGEAGQFFSLQCHPEHAATTLFFPVWTKDHKPYPQVELPVMVWSESSPAKAMTFLVNKGFIAIAINSKERPDPQLVDFLGVLAGAKIVFAFSYLGTTYEFDAKYLPVARQKFAEFCALNFKQ